jgi:hypothetical protein
MPALDEPGFKPRRESVDGDAVRLRLAWIGDQRVRLVLLLVVLASLVAYVVTSWTGALGIGNGPAVGDCPFDGAPSVETVRRARLASLREDLRQMMFFDRSLRPYEQGPVPSGSAWSDTEPGSQASLDPSEGSYEMRWWMGNGDDVVADVMVFADTGRAHDFFERASSTGCRPQSIARAASFPPGGRNLAWRNPDGFAQEDVFLLRGRRAYRVAVVKAGAKGRIAAAARSEAFSLVNGLACALPDAACAAEPSGLVRQV